MAYIAKGVYNSYPLPITRGVGMKRFSTVCMVAVCLLGCSSTTDRPITSGDRVFGTYPGGETKLRVKVACSVSSGDGSVYMLPVSDYPSVSADSQGVFYESPLLVELQSGQRSVLLQNVGIHFPFNARPGSRPSLWTTGANLEWGTVSRVKRWALPEPCWKPYGTTMVIVHKGVEIPSR